MENMPIPKIPFAQGPSTPKREETNPAAIADAGSAQRRNRKSPQETHEDMQKYLNQLYGRSEYTRKEVSPSTLQIESLEGEKFVIERITDPNDPKIAGILEIQNQRFGPEETDSPEIIRRSVQKPKYIYLTVQNEQGEVMAFTQRSYLELEGEETTKEAIVFGGFTACQKKFEKSKMSTELNLRALQYALNQAKAQGHAINAFINEAVKTAEGFFNKCLLAKRLYFRNAQGNYVEVPYIQPPIIWDPKTGKPIDSESEEPSDEDPKKFAAPEHLMLKLFDDQQEVEVSELLRMVGAIYKDNYLIKVDEVKTMPTEEAKQKVVQTVRGFRDELAFVLQQAEGGKLYFFSPEEREAKRKELEAEGKKLIEHVY